MHCLMRFVGRRSHCLKRSLSNYSKKDSLFDALNECRGLKFKAQRIKTIPGHSFSGSSSHQIFDLADDQGHFQDSRNRDNTNLRLYHYVVKFDVIFQSGFRIINNFLTDKSKVDDSSYLAIGSLLTYLNRLDLHQKSLQTLTDIGSSSLTETETAIILAVHLFSKLSIDDCTPSYMVSNEMPNKYKRCPCDNENCKHDVIYGNTFIGSEHLFYGHPDIVVFPKGAGSCSIVVPKKFKGEEVLNIHNSDESSQMPMVEVKKKNLRNKESQNQIASMAITFSFYQRLRQHRKKLQLPTSKLVSVIPTIAINQDSFDIYMYDTENDIFFVNAGDPIPLWEDQDNLSMSSILTLWIILNHLTFQPKIPNTMSSLRGSGGIQSQWDKNRMEMIEKTLRMSNSRYMPLKVENKILEQAGEIEFGADTDSK